MKIILPITALAVAMLCQVSGQTPPPTVNIGHYQSAGYEYFAEELPPGAAPAAGSTGIRSRLFVLPAMSVLPWTVSAYDDTGARVTTTNLSQAIGAGKKGSYFCRVSFRLGAPEISSLTKALLVGNVHNAAAMSQIPNSLYLSRLLVLSEGSNLVSKEILAKLETEVKPKLDRYAVEVSSPQGLFAYVSCNGKEIGTFSTGPSEYLANGSVIAVDCKDVDSQTARLFLEGRFTISCRMVIQASRVQSILAEYDLNRFYKAFAEEFMRRETVSKGKSRGFLFWRKTSRAVSTTIEASSSASIEAASRLNMSLMMRDVTDDALVARATNFLFQDKGEADEAALRQLRQTHLDAASAALKLQPPDKAAAEAHQKYADMLQGMIEKTEDLDKRTEDAMAALGTLGSSGSNPYLAIAKFLVNGIVWSTNEASDKLSIHQARSATWSESESRRFSAMIAQQAALSYTIVQSEFPEFRLQTLIAPGGESTKSFSPLEWDKAIKGEILKATTPE